MTRFPCILALLLAAPTPSCGSRADEATASTAILADERPGLERDIAERRTSIEAEIARLGPNHPWAGRYYEGDGLGSNTSIWIAPEAGCLAVFGGCMGTYGANWGKVEARGTRITLVFERAAAADLSASFDSEYEIERAGDGRVLNPRSSNQPLSLQR